MKKTSIVCILVFLITFPSLVFAAKSHKVRKNETIYTLASKYHVTVEDLKSANNLISTKLKKGDVLVIPPRAASAASDEHISESAGKYRVKRGDTLLKVAKKTGVSVSELKKINGLKVGRVKPGQLLALKEGPSAQCDERERKPTRKYSARVKELFTEEDNELTLADLAEFDPAKPVDLGKNLALKPENANLLKKKAFGFLGIRYRFGGNTRSGLDCSSFVQQVFREMSVDLPRTAREQFVVGDEVLPSDLKKGDLIFFRTYASFPSHVGIYLGDNKMIHASSRDRRVVISRMDTSYYRSRFIGAKRIPKINPAIPLFDDLILGVEEETEADIINNDTLGVSLNN